MLLSENLLNKVSLAAIQPVKENLSKASFKLKALKSSAVPGLLIKLNTLQDEVANLAIPQPSFAKKIDDATSEEPSQSGWQDNLKKALHELKDLVVIRYHEKPLTAQQFPQNRIYMREQLALYLAQAEWAVLREQNELFHDSINQATNWLEGGFDLTDAKVDAFKATLSELKAATLEAEDYPDLSSIIDELNKQMSQSPELASTEDKT